LAVHHEQFLFHMLIRFQEQDYQSVLNKFKFSVVLRIVDLCTHTQVKT